MTELDPNIIIPTMSTETERTFSDTKHIIPPTRTSLGADIVEAEKFLRAWYKAGI
jgi:hAT family C-terminal dimerisation region